MAININDIDYSLSALNQAIKEHYQWAERLLCLNLFGGKADTDIITEDAYLHCHFSEWLSLRAQRDTLDREEVATIDCHHLAMHHIARRLAQAVISGTATREMVNRYHEQQQVFIDSIEAYKSLLFAYRNQHDTLTGLPLRYLFYQDFPAFIARCKRNQSGLYILMMDIDRFKCINDTWGHNAGDEVLRLVAQRLKSVTRETESLYRFGGEEFIILLEATSQQSAQLAAERIRRSLAEYQMRISGQLVNVTITVGLTCVLADESLNEAVCRADEAMYYGKNNGRNCSVTYISGREMSLIASIE